MRQHHVGADKLVPAEKLDVAEAAHGANLPHLIAILRRVAQQQPTVAARQGSPAHEHLG